MSGAPEYSVFTLDLTTAGTFRVDQMTGVLRFLDAVDGSGAIQADAKISARLGKTLADLLPLRLGQGIVVGGVADRLDLSWDAQASVLTAVFLLSPDPGQLDMDADPPAKVTSGVTTLLKPATIISYADVSLGAAATTEILPAAATRREAIITNLSANTETFRIADSNAGATRGIPLAPGGALILETTAAIEGYNPGAGAESVAVIEILD